MSKLSTRLGQRRTTAAPRPDPAHPGSSTLADLARGDPARIVEVRADEAPDIARRLCDLGFVPGAEVTMVHRAPLADPLVFRVAGYEIALRRAQARSIRVEPR